MRGCEAILSISRSVCSRRCPSTFHVPFSISTSLGILVAISGISRLINGLWFLARCLSSTSYALATLYSSKLERRGPDLKKGQRPASGSFLLHSPQLNQPPATTEAPAPGCPLYAHARSTVPTPRLRVEVTLDVTCVHPQRAETN